MTCAGGARGAGERATAARQPSRASGGHDEREAALVEVERRRRRTKGLVRGHDRGVRPRRARSSAASRNRAPAWVVATDTTTSGRARRPGRQRGPAAQLQGDAYVDADADIAAGAHVAEKSTQRRGCSTPARRCEARRRGSNGAARDALPMDADTAASVTDAHDAERSTRCRVCSAPTRRCGWKRLARWRTTPRRPGRRLCWRAGKEDTRGIWGVSRRRRPRKARFRRVRRGAARCVA